jgi:microcystin-dependent protein
MVVAYAGLLAGTDGTAETIAHIKATLARQGWLYCDGSEYACAEYWELYGVIGNSFGIDEQTKKFRVPDLRGRFVRGVDDGTARDPDAAARQASAKGGASGGHVGSIEADAFQGHEHDYVATMMSPSPEFQPGEAPPLIQNPVPQATTSIEPDGTHGQPRVASETRPVNLALNYLIRYR